MPALSLLFHLTDWVSGKPSRDGVSLDSAKRAILWCELLEAHARKIYSIAEVTELHSAHALARKIQEGTVKDGDSLRSIYRPNWSLLSKKEDVEAALIVLQDHHWVRIEKVPPREGRPTELIRLHTDFTGEA